MLGRLYPTIYGLPWKAFPMAFFCSQKQISPKLPLSKEAQKIIWNWAIINYIRDPSLPLKEGIPSLRQQIINISLPKFAQKYQFCPEIKNLAIKPFDEGIALNGIIYNQTRISQATQRVRTAKVLNEPPFIFCPNFLVTQKIFQYLLPFPNQVAYKQNLLLTGGPGIGKTASIILFVHLANQINRNYFQVLKSQQKKKELLRLQTENLVCKPTLPHYFYWSLKSAAIEDQMGLQKLILQQAPQLSEIQKQQLLKITQFQQFMKKLKSFYPLTQNYRVVVDQINQLASSMRKQNHFMNLQQSTKIDFVRWKYFEETQTYKLSKLYQKFKNIGSSFILNSSQTIEQQLLYVRSINFIFNLHISKHDKIPIIRVPFEQNLLTQEGLRDFGYIFEFQLQRNLSILANQVFLSRQIINNVMKVVKENLQVKIQNAKIGALGSFLHIRNHIEKFHPNFKNIFKQLKTQKELKDIDIQSLTNLISTVIKEFDKYCVNQRASSIKDFYQKGDQARKKIIEIFHIQSSLNIEKKLGYQIFNFDLNTLKENPTIQILTANRLLDDIFKDSNIKNVFQYKQNNNIIQFPWTNLQFFLLMLRILYPKQYSSYDSIIQAQKEFKDRAFLGKIIEQNLLRCLGIGSYFGFKTKDSKSFGLWVEERTFFYSLNVPRKKEKETENVNVNVNFFQNCKQLLQLCKLHENKNILATPTIIKKNQMTHNQKHPSIDFLCAQYRKQDCCYEINSFDITIAGPEKVKAKDYVYPGLQTSRKNSQQKRKDKDVCKTEAAIIFFNKIFEKIKQQSQKLGVKIIFTHYILCPNNSIPKKPKINTQDFKIDYLNIFSLKVQSYADNQSHYNLMKGLAHAKAQKEE